MRGAEAHGGAGGRLRTHHGELRPQKLTPELRQRHGAARHGTDKAAKLVTGAPLGLAKGGARLALD